MKFNPNLYKKVIERFEREKGILEILKLMKKFKKENTIPAFGLNNNDFICVPLIDTYERFTKN